MKIKTKENLNAIFYFGLLFILTFGAAIFNFRVSSAWQIIWGSLFLVAFITFFVFTILEMKRSKYVSEMQFIIITCCHLMMFWIILLTQFGGISDIWAKFKIIIATTLLGYFIFRYLHWGRYLKVFIRDKVLRTFSTVAVFISIFGLVYFFAAQISFVLKVGLGIDFILLVYAIINAIFYNDKQYFKPEDRNTFIYKLISISLYAIAIFLFPYYLKWCGLDEQSFSIFIPVYSYVVGGMLTLGGVAWTIRKSEIDKRLDDIKRSKPVVFIYDKTMMEELGEKPVLKTLLSHKKYGTLEIALRNEKAFTVSEFLIHNSDYSHVAVKGFKINEEFHVFDIIQVLPKNATVKLQNSFRFRFDDKIEYVAILLEDMMENLYELEVEFQIVDGRLDVQIDITGGVQTKMTTLPKIYDKKT